MMPKYWKLLALMVVFLAIFLVASCAKTKISTEPAKPTAEEEARKAEEARQRELERQRALKEEDLAEESLSQKMARERTEGETTLFENEDIHFEFDSIRLSSDAQKILVNKARWLQENPEATVTIEGHCDNRGTNEYNLALGEERANSAKTFLVDLGIEPSRMTTISFGEERPIDTRQTEDAWAKNRRAHFVIDK